MDDYRIIDLEPIRYQPSTDDFKKAIVSDLVNNFFDFNNYIDTITRNTIQLFFINDEYLKNFRLFYRDKIADLDTTFILQNGVSEKEVYSIENLNETEIIERVFGPDDWSVIMMYKDVLEQIKKCNEALLKMGESAQIYIEAHDEYTEINVKDSDILKKKIKDKIARVVDED